MQRALASRPSAARPVARRGAVVARAGATKAPTIADVRAALDAAEKLEKAGAGKAEVKAAWDKVAAGAASAASAVFQLSEAELAARSVSADKVLENFCDSNPDADECRVYDD